MDVWVWLYLLFGLGGIFAVGAFCWWDDSPGWAIFWWLLGCFGLWDQFLRDAYEDAKRRNAAAREEARREREMKEADQQRIVSFMSECDARATEILRSIRNHLTAAGRHLDAADREFSERAFTPFWAEIEAAATSPRF